MWLLCHLRTLRYTWTCFWLILAWLTHVTQTRPRRNVFNMHISICGSEGTRRAYITRVSSGSLRGAGPVRVAVLVPTYMLSLADADAPRPPFARGLHWWKQLLFIHYLLLGSTHICSCSVTPAEIQARPHVRAQVRFQHSSHSAFLHSSKNMAVVYLCLRLSSFLTRGCGYFLYRLKTVASPSVDPATVSLLLSLWSLVSFFTSCTFIWIASALLVSASSNRCHHFLSLSVWLRQGTDLCDTIRLCGSLHWKGKSSVIGSVKQRVPVFQICQTAQWFKTAPNGCWRNMWSTLAPKVSAES